MKTFISNDKESQIKWIWSTKLLSRHFLHHIHLRNSQWQMIRFNLLVYLVKSEFKNSLTNTPKFLRTKISMNSWKRILNKNLCNQIKQNFVNEQRMICVKVWFHSFNQSKSLWTMSKNSTSQKSQRRNELSFLLISSLYAWGVPP